jgi:hypothetical protein
LEPLEETRRANAGAVASSQQLKPPVPKSNRKAKSRGGSPAGGEEVVDKRDYVD